MNTNPGITIAVATYNRRNILEKMVKSLYLTDIGSNTSIRIYDDASTEFDKEFLEKAFYNSKAIIRNPVNLGPNKNMYRIFADFIDCDDDILILADSDLIFNREWLAVVERVIDHTDGVMSLYNSALHPEILGTYQINNIKMLSKKAIGGAGTVFKKDIVKTLVSDLPPRDNPYDLHWSEFFVKSGIRLLVTERSYVQHIGIHGFHCGSYLGGDLSGSICDYGINFIAGNEYNEKIQNDFFNELLHFYTKEIENFKKIIFKPGYRKRLRSFLRNLVSGEIPD